MDIGDCGPRYDYSSIVTPALCTPTNSIIAGMGNLIVVDTFGLVIAADYAGWGR